MRNYIFDTEKKTIPFSFIILVIIKLSISICQLSNSNCIYV